MKWIHIKSVDFNGISFVCLLYSFYCDRIDRIEKEEANKKRRNQTREQSYALSAAFFSLTSAITARVQ